MRSPPATTAPRTRPVDVDALDARVQADLAALGAQARDERVGEPAGAAARARPAHRVAHQVQVRGGDALPAPVGGTSPCIAAP